MTKLITLAICGTLAAGAQSLEEGRKQFEGRCAGCHGADANGGERALGILGGRRARSQGIGEIIRTGIPDGGMPAFQMPDAELDAIVAYQAGTGKDGVLISVFQLQKGEETIVATRLREILKKASA